MGCVYLATNTVNNKSYVGWALDFHQRRDAHRSSFESCNRKAFYLALRKYGWDKFTWRTVFHSEDIEELKLKEIETIRTLNTMCPDGYNMTKGGDGFTGKHNEESKRKISINSGSRRPEVREKLSKALKGRVCSETHKATVSKALRGRPLSESQRRNIEKSAKVRRGVPLSEEHKMKISKTMLSQENHAKRPEVRKKISDSNKGRIISPEMRKKISATLTGRKNGPPSEETKKKIAESVKSSWTKRRLNLQIQSDH